MPYHDLHVKFKPSDYGQLGFASVAIAGENVDELLRKGVKRYDLLFVSSFYPDTALMRAVAEEEKAFEIPINGLLRSGGYSRANLLARMRFFIKLCTKYKADYVMTSRAGDEYEMKSVDELVAIGGMLGLSPPQAKRALSTVPERIMEGARDDA